MRDWHESCLWFRQFDNLRSWNNASEGMRDMNWSEFEDEFTPGKSKRTKHRHRQRFDENEDGNDYRRKRSCQRLHRNKTPKDESWEDIERGDSTRHNPKD